jgi:DNA-binding MarR family transcriptional regulator
LGNDPLDALYGRPGFMIRRAHQIAVSIFLEETQAFGVTTTQYGVLYLLKHRPGLDQISVAKMLGLDRSTTALVVRKLEHGRLIERAVDLQDQRRRNLRLTSAGHEMLAALGGPVVRAQQRALSIFDDRERQLFLSLLDRFTTAFNRESRIPIERPPFPTFLAPIDAPVDAASE